MGSLKDWAGKELTLTLVSRVSIPRRPYIPKLLTYCPGTFPAQEKHTRKRVKVLRGHDILGNYARILGKHAQEEQAVLQPNSDLDLLRDLLELERSRNSFQDKRIYELEKRCQELESRISPLEVDGHELDERVSALEPTVADLRYQVSRNAELEYMENPYALDGSPRCHC